MAKLSVIHANIESYNSHAGLLEPGTLKQGFARNFQCQREALWDPFKWEAEMSLQKPQKWVREWDVYPAPIMFTGRVWASMKNSMKNNYTLNLIM